MRLCINCDDFGFSSQINQGIFEAIEQNLLRSCSVLADLLNVEDSNRLKQLGNVSVGLHFSLTTLKQGEFALVRRPLQLVQQLVSHNLSEGKILAELERQYQLLLQLWQGPITHIDTHQHIHTIPKIRRIIKDFSHEMNIPFVRIPKEISYKKSFKKAVLNTMFLGETTSIPFWGTSFMGKEFRKDKIIRQIKYLKKKKVDSSIWMVHVGHFSTGNFTDSYNIQREHELKVLKELSGFLSNETKVSSMQEIL